MKFENEQLFTAMIYFSEKKPAASLSKKEVLIYEKSDLNLDEPLFEEKINITLPDKAMKNGTFYSRVVLFPTGQKQHATQAFGKMISHQVPIRYANLFGDDHKEKGNLV